jgi:oligosaccharide repeat unit polymerase
MLVNLLITTLAILLCAYCAFRQYYTLLAFNSAWIVILLLFKNSKSINIFLLGNETLCLLLLMILFLNIGYGFGGIRFKRSYHITKKGENKLSIWKLNESAFHLLLGISLIICAYYALRTISSYGFDLALSRKASAVSGNDEQKFKSVFDTVLFYGVASPIVNLSLVVFAYQLMTSKVTKKSIFLIIANIALFTVTSAGRMIVVRLIIYVATILICLKHLYKRKSNNQISFSFRKFVFVFLIAIIVLNILTVARNSKDVSFVNQTVEYIQGSIIHMDYHIKAETFSEQNSFLGRIAIGGFFYYPIKFLNLIFGTQIKTSNEVMEYLQAYIKINLGNLQYYNALTPAAYYYYVDSGYFGVLFFSFIHGIILRKAEFPNKNQYSFLNFAILCYALYAALFTPLGGILWNIAMPITIIYTIILSKVIYSRKLEHDVSNI